MIKAVEAKDPDVVMVGSRSHTLISDAFIGSVAWDIVRKEGRPVLLQRIEPRGSGSDVEEPWIGPSETCRFSH